MKQHLSHTPGPIGVFDSGYGGLTILSKIREALPEYDYVYLGDNARAPYGTRSFEVVYEFCILKRRQLESLMNSLIETKQGSVTKQDNVDRDHSFSISILNVLISFLMFLFCENFFF